MKYWLRTAFFVLAGIVVVEFVVAPLFRGRQTTQSLSPNDGFRAILRERGPSFGIDRNFVIQLENVLDGEVRTIFKSPDEGRPIGSERFAWSTDSKRVLLVGRHFYTVDDDITLKDGSRPYFLYDLETRDAWCNADQVKDLPRITSEKLIDAGFKSELVDQAK